jgi:hypothetical protein
MEKLIINRGTWVCGNHFKGKSQLLNSAGQRCCLGFLGKHIGLDDKFAKLTSFPSYVKNHTQWPERLFEYANQAEKAYGPSVWKRFEGVFAQINDSEIVPDDVREDWIKEGFKTILGFDVEFTGEYP